jgi:hypothetical protein
MTHNAFDAERRKRHQQITGKIGNGVAYAGEYHVPNHDGQNVAANQRRGNLASLGAFMNQEAHPIESSKHRPHGAYQPSYTTTGLSASSPIASPTYSLASPSNAAPARAQFAEMARRSDGIASVLHQRGPASGATTSPPTDGVEPTVRLSSEKDFGALMHLVYSNSEAASRSFLDFEPSRPPF